MTDSLTGVNQKIPHWLITMMFLGEADTTIRSDINLGLVSWDFSRSDTIWACGFLFNPRWAAFLQSRMLRKSLAAQSWLSSIGITQELIKSADSEAAP